MTGKRALATGAVLVLLGLAAYLIHWRTEQSETTASGATAAAAVAPRGVPVTTAKAERQPVDVTLEVVGAAEAISSVAVKSQVDGRLLGIGFHEGDRVHRGDLLLTIDPRTYDAQLRQAEANLARDQAQLAQAQADQTRYQGLAQRGVASQQQYEASKSSAAALTATLAADQAAIDIAKLQLEYTAIKAPIDGRVGSLLIDSGNLVKANDTSPIVVINQTQPIYVAFAVAEQYLARIKERFASGADIHVTATIPNATTPPEEGKLTFIDNNVDRSTGTIQLKATFQNAYDRLTPGQFVRVSLALSSLPDALVVPSQAIQTGQNGFYVFVVKSDHSVDMRPIVLGPVVKGVTVVDKGVEAGEEVVTEGQLRLAPGTKVEVRPPQPATGQTS